MTQVTVFGSANIDLVAPVSRLPGRGETVMGADLITAFGGKGANAAVAASRLGASTQFVAKLGKDRFGADYLEHLRSESIDVSFVGFADSHPTGTALIVLDDDGQNMIVVCPGANGSVSPMDAEAASDAIRRSRAVLVQFEIPLDTVRRVIELSNSLSVPVVLNPSPYNSAFLFDGLTVDYLIVNETEAAEITGASWDDPDKVISGLLATGARHVVVTRGSDPTLASDGSSAITVAASEVEAIDTVGAGDTFAGAFCVAIGEGRSFPDAITFANCAAALATTKIGAQGGMPTRQEAEEFLAVR